MLALPTADQERWLTITARLRLKSDVPWLAQRLCGWAAASLMTRCAFFVLGAVVAALTVAVFELLDRSTGTLFSGAVLIGIAEWLIRGKRLFHAGVEEALWAGGALVIATYFASSGEVAGAVLIALALAIAALRLLNPLFLTLSVLVASAAIEINLTAGHRLLGQTGYAIAPSVFCYLIGCGSLFMGRIELRRPSHDQMLSWLTVSMPLCGFLWLATEHAASIRLVTTLTSLGYGAAALIMGLRRRAHAPLIACLICVGCTGYQLRDLTPLPLEFKLMLWGGAALMLAWGLERYLRTPRRGITSHRIAAGGDIMELAQILGAAALAPKGAAQGDAPFKGEGGNFGGGGAEESY